jgi:hypothetical protein
VSGASVRPSAHVGPALAEGILRVLGQREYAIGRRLPRGVPTLYVTLGDDLHDLQHFASSAQLDAMYPALRNVS